MSTNSSASGPARPRLVPAIAGRGLLGLAATVTALTCLAAVALWLSRPVHAPGAKLELAVLLCVPLLSLGSRWPLPVLALATAAASLQMAYGAASLLASRALPGPDPGRPVDRPAAGRRGLRQRVPG